MKKKEMREQAIEIYLHILSHIVKEKLDPQMTIYIKLRTIEKNLKVLHDVVK